jgi:hypothetical protein
MLRPAILLGFRWYIISPIYMDVKGEGLGCEKSCAPPVPQGSSARAAALRVPRNRVAEGQPPVALTDFEYTGVSEACGAENGPTSTPLGSSSLAIVGPLKLQSRSLELFLTLLIRDGCRRPPAFRERASHTPAGIMRTRRGAAVSDLPTASFHWGAAVPCQVARTATWHKNGGSAPRSGFSTRKLLGGNETKLGRPLLRSAHCRRRNRTANSPLPCAGEPPQRP